MIKKAGLPFNWRVWQWKLYWQILFGLILGALLGWLLGAYALSVMRADPAVESARTWVTQNWVFLTFQLIGDLFLNGLRLIVIPLVTSSIVMAIANLAKAHGFGRMSLKTLGYFTISGLLAVTVGITLVNVIQPGIAADGRPLLTVDEATQLEQEFREEAGRLTAAAEQARRKLERQEGGIYERVLSVLRELVPANPFVAAIEFNLLGLIVVSMLIGFFMTRLQGPSAEVLNSFWQAVYQLSMLVTQFILKFAPLGIGALLFTTIADNYATLAQEHRFGQLLASLLWFSMTTVSALCIHALIVLPLLLLLARINPTRHFQAVSPALLTAFSTASSNATLPITLQSLEARAGVSNRTSSFVAPLGATANMDGTALYECVAAMFIIQLFGVHLDFAQQFMVVMIALLTSIGVAGVPSASLVAIVVILQAVERQVPGVPLEAGLPILLVLDRPLDMFRTAVNVFSDTCGTVLIAKSEGETNLYKPLINKS